MKEKQKSTFAVNPARRMSPGALLRASVYLLLPPILLFGGAGTLNWSMGWLYLIITIGGVILSRILVYRVHPDLLAERATSMEAENVPNWDRKLAPIVATWVPMILVLVAGLDKRFGWSPALSPWVLAAGTLVILIAVALAIWAMVSNRFFSAYVRLQSDRGQQVVNYGPYASIRHPGYAAGILADLGAPLMLGTLWALLPAFLGIIAIFWRTQLEDRYLHTSLTGYPEYAKQVRRRIVPFFW
jgi:protein-S-isoprenylcysteine O-methyltransferase Ste14